VHLERIQRLVQQTIDIDVAATWADYAATADDADPDAFLAFLRERDLLDPASFVELHGHDAIALDAPDDPPPVGRYDLLGPVGRGAMGMVHVARDVDLRRKVAFKTMLRSDPLLRRRFLDEVRITAQLDHPNVVPVYSLSRDDEGRPAYAMKLVRGRTLERILADARRDPTSEELGLASRLELFLKVCDAVSYAHDKGIVHRDLKPDNVMVGRFGEVYVMDWGIAKLLGQPERPDPVDAGDPEASPDRTRVGALVGTPAYMAPEQANGEPGELGPHSDQFALGLLLFEIVHLEQARRADDVVGMLIKASTGAVDPPSRRGHPEIDAIVARATARRPADRYPSVQALEADVRRHLRGEETVALPDRAPTRARRWIARHPRAAGLIALTVIVASLLAVGWTAWRRQADLAAQALASEVREGHITAVLGQVSGRAQRIDNDLLWYEGMLQAIGDSATYALARGTPTSGPFWHTSAFRDPATAPPGMSASTAYGKPIHPEFPVFTVAPGVPEAVWRRDLGLLDGLRDTIRKVFVVSPTEATPDPDRVRQQARIADGSRSLRWAYVALERSGLMYMFPGAQGWDDKYDPRTRPWYRDGVGRHGRVWSTPYVDLMGQGRLISCILPLYDEAAGFLGVAGIDLQFDALLDELLVMGDLPGYRAAYLLTDQGRVMLKTTAHGDPVVIPPTEALDPGIDFGTFAHAAVVEGARARRSGHVLVGQELLVWAPLQHLGWTYVVAADAPGP
jgi:eukaryotic-like serine/threonine-protein kinase